MSPKRPAVLIPLGLFLISFLFRLVGIGWGLPNELHNQSYHPDELVNWQVAQQIDISKGKFTPGFYNYGTAYFIAENVVTQAIAGYGGGPKENDPQLLWQFIGRCQLGGRILNALAGAGCVVVAWLILRRITTMFGAVFGAAMIAIAPGFLVHSRFETVDVFATFWLFLSALFALRILGPSPDSMAADDVREPNDLKDALLAGLFAGISMGTKYTGVLVLLVLFVAIGLTRRPNWWKPLLAGIGACFLAFVLTTPGFLFDRERFWQGFGFEMSHSATGHGLVFMGTPSGFVFHLVNLAVGVGILLTIAGFAGSGYAAYRKHGWAIAVLVFAVVYYLAIGRAEVKFLRYTFPLLLPLALGFGYMMGTARRRGGWGHAVVAAGIIAIAGLDFGGFAGAVRYTQMMAASDPRDEAALHLRDVAKNATVGLVSDPWFYSPALIPDAGFTRDQLPLIFNELERSEHPKVVRYIPNGDPAQRVDWDVRLLTETRPEYVVYSSFEENDVQRLTSVTGLDPGTQSQVDRYTQFRTELEKTYNLAAPFGIPAVPAIHDLMYIHPTLFVWKRKDLP